MVRPLSDVIAEAGISDLEAATLLDQMRLIEKLRADEGDCVIVYCDNPDGPPNCAIECFGGWTDFVDRRFVGETLLEALSAAVTTREGATTPNERRPT